MCDLGSGEAVNCTGYQAAAFESAALKNSQLLIKVTTKVMGKMTEKSQLFINSLCIGLFSVNLVYQKIV